MPSTAGTGLEIPINEAAIAAAGNAQDVIGKESTIQSTKLEPLEKDAVPAEPKPEPASVLDSLADSQPAKTAGDLYNSAAGMSHSFAYMLVACSITLFAKSFLCVALATSAYEAVVGKKE